MNRQHMMLSIALLLVTTPIRAHDRLTATDSARPPPLPDIRLRLDLNPDYSRAPRVDLINSVTMRRLPPGSVIFRYEGMHRFIVRHARSQYRKAVRTAQKRGWYVRPEIDSLKPLFQAHAERDFAGNHVNGAWWTRSWMSSMLPELGGAPDEPHIHTYGVNTSLNLGPLTITNSLNVRLDYIGLFELNPNPVDQEGGNRKIPISIDVNPLKDRTSTGTEVKFGVKPHFRIGIPRNGSWKEIIRKISLRGTFELIRNGRKLIDGEVAIKWQTSGGVTVTFDLALVSW